MGCIKKFKKKSAYLLDELVGVAEGHDADLVEAELLLEERLGDALEGVAQVTHDEQADRINETDGLGEQGLGRNELLPKFTELATLQTISGLPYHGNISISSQLSGDQICKSQEIRTGQSHQGENQQLGDKIGLGGGRVDLVILQQSLVGGEVVCFVSKLSHNESLQSSRGRHIVGSGLHQSK